ncbi:RNA 2',3'-cyclic phosphodiesterase [Bacillus sp. NPDC077027]|uniref:RNA 2',3'-cyclic phosphodiesterase n=1 Tax=Bacillus sp. NPDC077027 TaxID=3390548 RepID=UPI003D0471C9
MALDTHYFIGIYVPDHVAHKIEQDIRTKSGLYFQKWTAPSDYHVTLVFLGAIADEPLCHVTKLLDQTASQIAAFPLEIQHLGIFGTAERPRVFFAEPNENKALMMLREKIKQAVLQTGHPVEARPFHPHMTIARKWTAEEPYVEEASLHEKPYTFQVSEFVLYQICPKETPRYKPLKRFILHN